MIPDSVDFIEMKSINHKPVLTISGEALFASNFFPDQMLVVEIYDGKIIIKPLDEIKKFELLVKLD